MRQLLIATKNKGKLPEIIEKLTSLPFEFLTLNDFDTAPVEENGDSFEENAILKAKGYGIQTGLLTLADDSGMCVDALNGAPGVFSARFFAGDKNKKILEDMDGIPLEKRTARYIAVVAIYDPKTDRIFSAKGTCEGYITESFKGENGFGFDPIFFSKDLGKTMAEATVNEKNSVSHRGKALQKMREVLTSNYQ